MGGTWQSSHSFLLSLTDLVTTYRTEPRRDLVCWGLHYADQSGDQPHLHWALTGFNLRQLLEDVLSQRGDNRI